MLNDRCALVIDEDAHTLQILTSILTELDVRFKRITNGANVLAKLQASSEPLDFILLSIDLNTANAFQILKTIKANPRLAHVPVIALSDEPAYAVLAQVQQAGFSAFIPKPIPRRHFSALVERVLAGERVWEAATF